MIELCDQVLQHLSDIKALSKKLNSRFKKMKEAIEPYLENYKDDPEVKLIEKSLTNILENPEPFETPEELALFQNDCWSIFNAIQIFSNSMVNYTNKKCKEIERKLFNIVFVPDDEYNTRILPVYRVHDEFLNTESPISNFKSSTGSGKTRCAPFFFAIKAIIDKMKRPFFIMTQPSYTIIKDKIQDFTEILGDSVIYVTSVQELEEFYDDLPKKPVVALFTPHTLVKILARARDKSFQLVKYSRFVLDEIHERSVDTDVLVALLAKKMQKISFPLQLLMMSATPDPRILQSFTKVQEIELPDTQLFPIKDIPKVVNDFKELDTNVRDSAIDIINQMSEGTFKPGHILIFTSGNRRINNLMNLISCAIESKISQDKKNVKLLKKFDNFLTSQELFYDHLEEVLLNDPDYSDSTMYFLVIKYAGFVGKEAQQIGKNPIPGHPNVLKIIVATNSIESSITIDGLAAVIDSGICNIPNYDRTKGITNLDEGPISTQSQTQRRGRVGRKRDGICVQFTIKGHPPIELRPPAIETEDISSNILGLRKIKINLEDIDNLPLPGVSPENMKSYMDELIKIGALDKNKNLTDVGYQLAAFSSMSPFVSSSILKVANKYDDSTIASIVGALAFLVLTTNNIYVEAVTDSFRRNFCEDSDIITLMSSLIEMMQNKGNLRKKLSECGFHPSNGVKLIASVEQIGSIIYDDDKQSLWPDISNFFKSNNMMKFIQRIMTNIGKVRPDWVSCRRCQYETVINVLNQPSFIYKGDKSLIGDGKTIPEIKVHARPGGKGFAAPGSCFVMQFNVVDSNNIYGSLIHKDLSRDEIPHPIVIEASIIMNNVYTVPLIDGYIGENKKKFKPFQKTNYNKGSSHGGFICYPEQFGDKTVLSYVPCNIDEFENTKVIMNEAIQKVEQIIPFTPRTILVKNDVLKSIVLVTSFGLENFTTKVINFTDQNPNAYQIDKITIDYLIAHKKELGDIDGHLVVALTGENFSYLTEQDDYFGNPITWSSLTSVFSQKSDCYSHMIILSNTEIPKATKLTWVDRKISVTYSDVDALIHVSNTVFRGVVEINHEYDEVYFMNRNANIAVDGKRPTFHDTTQDSDVFRPIGCMFDSFAMQCIKGSTLVHDVELNKFMIGGNIQCEDIKKDIISFKSFQKNHKDIKALDLLKELYKQSDVIGRSKVYLDQRQQAFNNLNAARAEMKRLGEMFNTRGVNKKDIINQQAVNKQERERYQNEINRLNEIINQINQPLIQICNRFNINEKDARPLFTIRTPIKILESGHINVSESSIDANIRVDDRDELITALTTYKNNLVYEIVPISSITVYNRVNSNVTEEEFVNIIDKICKRFGGVVKSKTDFIKSDKDHFNNGFIKISLFTGEFAIPFAGEVQRAVGCGDKVLLRIPSKIVPNCLMSRPDVVESIENWIAEYHLNLKKSGFRFSGTSQEIEKATNLFTNKDTQPKIPYKTFTIPGGIEISKVMADLNRKNSKLSIRSRWGINKSSRLIYVPDEIDDETVQEFINSVVSKDKKKQKIDELNPDEVKELIYDYLFYCDDIAVLSALQIPIYLSENTVRMDNYCVTCAYDLFKTEVERLFDQEEDKPRMSLLCENIEPIKPIQLLPESPSSPTSKEWPEVPLGQLLWCLVSEPVMSSVVKTWFSAIVYQAFHSSPYFDFCPDHPSILIKITKDGGRIKCSQPGCGMYLCEDCHKWHKRGECKSAMALPPGFRMCPGCHRPVEKTEACNHLACKCGKHFCYYCGWGPCDDSNSVYQHLAECHKGCFNNPPDYRKYYLHEPVPDHELQEFYDKYPQFQPVEDKFKRK